MIFKYIHQIVNIKNATEKPQEFISETIISAIKNFFVTSFVILAGITLILFFIALNSNSLFFPIAAVLFTIALIIDIFLYFFIKKMINNAKESFVETVKKNTTNNYGRIIEVD